MAYAYQDSVGGAKTGGALGLVKPASLAESISLMSVRYPVSKLKWRAVKTPEAKKLGSGDTHL